MAPPAGVSPTLALILLGFAENPWRWGLISDTWMLGGGEPWDCGGGGVCGDGGMPATGDRGGQPPVETWSLQILTLRSGSGRPASTPSGVQAWDLPPPVSLGRGPAGWEREVSEGRDDSS